MGLKDKVYNFPTKYEQGFIQSEIEKILEDSPEINMDKFNDALRGNTFMVIDGNIITYHCDILHALRCGLENRDLKWWEWD